MLIIGNGGREHALAWKLSQSPLVDQIFIAPGADAALALSSRQEADLPAQLSTQAMAALALGTRRSRSASPSRTLTGSCLSQSRAVCVLSAPVCAHTAHSEALQVNLVIPGGEQTLVDGIEGQFRHGELASHDVCGTELTCGAVGIPVFGPSVKAAMMEGSKTFSKDFMARHNIPTAVYGNFTKYEDAVAFLDKVDYQVVIKASGLAAGKGVLIPETKEEAKTALQQIMVDKVFGRAGDEVVIEECLTGQELSVLAFSDGYTVVPMPAAQDHKRIGEGDTGLNTGGMGAYSPAPVATKEVEAEIYSTIVKPTIDGLRHDGMSFVGMLFVGIMLTPQGPKVLEYNVRFGDPEAQTLLPLLSDDTDLAEVLLACVERRLDSVTLKMKSESAVTVVLASQGYPNSYPKGLPITIGELPANVQVFHAGTSFKDGQVLTAGGRVLAVTATASTLLDAQKLAYEGVKAISFEGATFRRDIAYKAFLQQKDAADKGLTYASAGVSIDAGNDFVERIKPVVKQTRRPGADSSIGGFGGVFDLAKAGYRDPLLVSGTDGVGTKLRVAQMCGKHTSVGIDLVAMSVNDLLVQGAEPLYFLDYFACGKLDVDCAADVVAGVARGCVAAGCALIGGETAEMPSMYTGDDYDVAGFAVGAVERSNLLPRTDIKAGDVLLGLTSSGVHSNGFSLVRKVVERSGLSLSAPAPWVSDATTTTTTTLGDEFLRPTRIYVKQVLAVLRGAQGAHVKGLAHITGGGFTDNVPRMLPKGVGCTIDASSYELPRMFSWLMRTGAIARDEMARTFNCGIGLVVAVDKAHAGDVVEALKAARASDGDDADVVVLGECVEGEGCEMRNLDSWQ